MDSFVSILRLLLKGVRQMLSHPSRRFSWWGENILRADVGGADDFHVNWQVIDRKDSCFLIASTPVEPVHRC